MFRSSFLRLVFFFYTLNYIAEGMENKYPNLLICIADNHAANLYNSLDKLGSSINPTPNLSRIEQSGFYHPLAYCSDTNMGGTALSFLSGLTQNSHLENFSKNNFVGHWLKSHGYETAFFGSWKSDFEPEYFGFSTWRVLEDPEIFFNPEIRGLRTNQVIEGHTTDIITDLALRWVNEEHDAKKPYFMVVSYQATMRPWIPPLRVIHKYNDEWFDIPDNFFTDFNKRTPANKYQNMNIAQDLDPINDLFFYSWVDANNTDSRSSILAKNLNSMNGEQKSAWGLSWKPQNEAFSRESPMEEALAIWKFQRFIKNYLRCLLAMDENIGRLVNSITKNTDSGVNFIYKSEKGSFTGEFGWFGSEWMYEPSSRIPLIFSSFNGASLPDLNLENLFVDKNLYHLLIKSIKFHKNQGVPQSIDPNFSAPLENILYFTQGTYPSKYSVSLHHGLRKGRYKLIHYYPFNEWEFYDLENDPNEQQNLFKVDQFQDIIKEYQVLLNEAAKESENEKLHRSFSEKWKRDQRSPEKKTR